MKKQLLEIIINKKKRKEEFAIITNISTGESCIYEKNKPVDKNFEKHSFEIKNYFDYYYLILDIKGELIGLEKIRTGATKKCWKQTSMKLEPRLVLLSA